MGRKEKREDARDNIWETAKDIQERIRGLEKIISEYPEYMCPYSDIADSYLALDDIDNAIKTYQGIIDLRDTFDFVWHDDLW